MDFTKLLLTLLFISFTMGKAKAQEAGDTISTVELDEVQIEAPRVIRKADMDVYHPSQSAVENSSNGL